MEEKYLNYKWHALNYSKFRVEKWSDEAVVFNPLSGETHQLDNFAIAVLDFIEQPFSLDSLSDQVYAFYDIEDRKKLSRQLKSLINQFDDLGLIEPYFE